MTYVIYDYSEASQFLIGDTPTFEKQVPDLSTRAKISSVFKNGTRELEVQEVPAKLVLGKKRKALGGVFITRNGLFIINGQVRDILEGLDPNVHQFFPIEVVYKGGSKPEGDYFVLNVTAQQDSIVDEASSVKSAPMPKQIHPYIPGDHDPERMTITHYKKNITVRPSAQTGLNMWRKARYPRVGKLGGVGLSSVIMKPRADLEAL